TSSLCCSESTVNSSFGQSSSMQSAAANQRVLEAPLPRKRSRSFSNIWLRKLDIQALLLGGSHRPTLIQLISQLLVPYRIKVADSSSRGCAHSGELNLNLLTVSSSIQTYSMSCGPTH